MCLPKTGLWQHPNFLKLWAGQTISVFGSQITFLALPLTAVVWLDASATEMSILVALETLPYLLVSLLAGVWVDRLQRHSILISTDIGRALLLLSIPILAMFGLLQIEYLYVITFLNGVLTLFFDVAEEAFLPSLLNRTELVEGNSKLATSNAIAEMAGPGIAGGLVQLLTAPIAILVDALSFLASALLIASIKTLEAIPTPHKERQSIWFEVKEGIQTVVYHPLLRPMVATSSMLQLFGGMYDALLILYLTQDLGLPPTAIGLVYAVGSLSGLLGTFLGTRLTQKLGLGRTIIITAFLIGLGWLFIPLASGPPLMAFLTIAMGAVFFGVGNMVYNINVGSLSQGITPTHLLGRVNATTRFISWGVLPIGSLIGGVLGSTIGLRNTLFVGGIGMVFAFLWVLFSPLRSLFEQPA